MRGRKQFTVIYNVVNTDTYNWPREVVSSDHVQLLAHDAINAAQEAREMVQARDSREYARDIRVVKGWGVLLYLSED